MGKGVGTGESSGGLGMEESKESEVNGEEKIRKGRKEDGGVGGRWRKRRCVKGGKG